MTQRPITIDELCLRINCLRIGISAACVHPLTSGQLVINDTMEGSEWHSNVGLGWLYAGVSKRSGLFKFGGTRQCPLCRMAQQKLRPVGIAFSDDWRVSEQVFLAKLGTPVKGLEWFDDADGRAKWVIEQGIVHPFSKFDQFVEQPLRSKS